MFNKLLAMFILAGSIMGSCSPVMARPLVIPITQVGTLIKVVDGDTIKLKVGSTIRNYRLAAIDTPETYNNKKAKKDILTCGVSKEHMFALGKFAKAYVGSMYRLGSVIRFTKLGVGVYNRPIIWIDGYQTSLVKAGLARVVIYNNVDESKIANLRKLESLAKSQNLGIWKTLLCWR